MKYVLKIAFLLAFSSVFTSITNAQIPGSIDGVEISVSPEYPSPGQNVKISLESYTTNLNAASIVWIVDGKNALQGIGAVSINVSAPDIGKKTAVTAVIVTAESKEVKKSVILKTGDVDLVWESSGYIPPLFKGKALFAYQNGIKVTAIPHLSGASGKEIDPKTLVYKWTKNDKVMQDQSGYGKQTFTFVEELPRPIEIEVIVTTRDGGEQGRALVTLEQGNPSLLFYEEDPLYGVFYNKAIKNRFTLKKEEVSILAVPYFFSNVGGENSPITYSWSINNLLQPDISTNRSITLRSKEDSEGSSDLSLEIRNTGKILQGAKQNTTLLFSKQTIDEEIENIF